MRRMALKQAETKFGRTFVQKSGNVGMQYIEPYAQPTDSDCEEVIDKLYP